MKKSLSVVSLTLGACMSLSAFSGCSFLENLTKKTLTGEEAQKAYEEVVKAMDFSKSYSGAFTMQVKMDVFGQKQNSTISVDPTTNRVYAKTDVEGNVQKTKIYKVDDEYYFHANSNDNDNPWEFRYASADEAYYAEMVWDEIFMTWNDPLDMGLEKVNTVWAELFEEGKADVLEYAKDPESGYYGVTYADGKIEYSMQKAGSAYIFKTEQYTILKCGEEEFNEYKYVTETKVEDGKVVGIKFDQTVKMKLTGADGKTRENLQKYVRELKYSYKFNENEYNSMKLSVEKDGEERSFAKGEDVLSFYGKENVQQPEYQYTGQKYLSVNGGANRFYYGEGNTIEQFFNTQYQALEENLNYTFYTDKACTQTLETMEQLAKTPVVYAVATPKDGYALVNETLSFNYADDFGIKEKVLLETISSRFSAAVIIEDMQHIRTHYVKEAGDVYEFSQGDFDLEDISMTYKLDGVEKQEGDTFTMESGKTYEVEYNAMITKAGLSNFMKDNDATIFDLFDII